MNAIYVLNELAGKRASPTGFATKHDAKIERNRLLGQGTTCVVSRGPDHPKGATRPDPRCRNIEKTAYKRHRKAKPPVE